MIKFLKKVDSSLFYLDLPRGQVKNNSMRKLQAKTLMEILPEDISKVVHQKLEQQGVSPEFMTLVGMVSYYTGKELE